MEESTKINRKKNLPSVPSNYVSLLQLKERWIKEKERKQKGKEEKEEPQQEQEEKETKVEERVHYDVAGRGSSKNGHFRRCDSENVKHVSEGKSREEKIAAGSAVSESEDVEKEKKGEELKNEKTKKMKKRWKKNKKNEKEEKARTDNEREEVVGPAVNPPLPASMENNKGEEEVIGHEVHAPKLARAEARRESQQRIMPKTDGHTSEIGRKFSAMSIKGEIRTGDYSSYDRQNGNSGNRVLNRRYYGKFDRRREQNQRNEGMVWVKKGEVSDGNVSGIQSSSCSSKELD
ncbi:protein MNN4-like [Durio zibethinus]|uniref:Protein MNN4-like n=1 Tax=Durio zibethinus TaxID=66656 RepID=A0A6P5ZCP4_DURZI|nr:protein MNN4-like [Durio zibethinus]